MQKDPKLAVGLVKYVRTSSELVKDQKLAAERGLAAALTRMGVKAADMPLPPPAEEVWNPWYLLGLLALIPILCFAEFCKTSNNPPPVVQPSLRSSSVLLFHQPFDAPPSPLRFGG
jgi:hypothetical protein